ncbi:MAG: MerR family transcriptional regulator [Nitrospirae bacterium]|nr:MerR family transcriptional regulator [Nitrospirota bacterium]MCL5238221.1 MerR family transcriptional regulator [Nitrospirota bacterium]
MHDAYKSPQPLKLFPEKLFYKIGEVSRIVGVESYVLRYWETEFPFLNPRKSKAGQRVYTKTDIDLIVQIKHLLYEEKYTIDGVRRKFGTHAEQPDAVGHAGMEPGNPGLKAGAEKVNTEDVLKMVKSKLKDLLNHHFGA